MCLLAKFIQGVTTGGTDQISGVPYVKLYRKTPKHLYPKFNGYGDIGQRKVWTSLVSAYCTLSVTLYSAYLGDWPRLLLLHSYVIARYS